MKIAVLGPTYPYRGGIAHHTTLMVQQLRAQPELEILLVSFARQYPNWLYRGSTDRDPSPNPLQTPAEYLIDTINPLTWRTTVGRLRAWCPELLVVSWWHPFMTLTWRYITSRLRRVLPDTQILFLVHNVLPHESGRLDKLALRIALQHADGFVTHSTPNRQRLEAFFPHTPVVVTPMPTFAALDSGASVPPARFVPAGKPLLLMCGLIRPYKGLDILLEALPAVLARHDVHLLVAGEFWEKTGLYEDQVARLGIGDAVTFDNRYVPDEELSAYVASASVVVLPYRSATQSAVVQLAFGHGCPVITTAVGGLPEAVETGVTGLVVPPTDVRALAAALNHYFDHKLEPQFRENIAERARAFSWTPLVDALLSFTQGKWS